MLMSPILDYVASYMTACPQLLEHPTGKARVTVRKLHLSLYKGEKMGPTKEERYDVETWVILPADRNHKTKEITMVIKSSSESLEAPGQDRRKMTLCHRGRRSPASALLAAGNHSLSARVGRSWPLGAAEHLEI